MGVEMDLDVSFLCRNRNLWWAVDSLFYQNVDCSCPVFRQQEMAGLLTRKIDRGLPSRPGGLGVQSEADAQVKPAAGQ